MAQLSVAAPARMRRMPSTHWKEDIPAGEDARLEALAQQLNALQKKHAEGGKLLRGLHAKGNAGVAAELTVLDGLPEEARVGIFGRPGSYRGWARFSNGAGCRFSDRRHDVRGFALKLVGVPGAKLIPGLENATTQDFLAIRTPSTPFRDAYEFMWFVGAADNPALLLPRAIGRFGLMRTIRIVRQVSRGVGAPMPSLATTRYFSALPIQFGAYAVRYAFTPQQTDRGSNSASPQYLREELAERLQRGPLHWDFGVQFFVDEARTPIEDASREWLESDAPLVTLARLTLPQQDLDSPRGLKLAEMVEKLSFDPWHAPVEFRPLGNMMRARNHAYRLSTQTRGAAPEPEAFSAGEP
jgi:hypothetical protein